MEHYFTGGYRLQLKVQAHNIGSVAIVQHLNDACKPCSCDGLHVHASTFWVHDIKHLQLSNSPRKSLIRLGVTHRKPSGIQMSIVQQEELHTVAVDIIKN